MKLLYGKSRWEMMDCPLEDFLGRARRDGFDVVEIFLGGSRESPEEIREQASSHGLGVVAQVVTSGATVAGHIESLKSSFLQALKAEPVLVNSHTGKDFFCFEDNLRIFEEAIRLQGEFGIPILHETHRGRPLFNAPETRRYLEALPGLGITADFSHWFCVHESDLSDQPDNLGAAIARAQYIHARAGYEEGPQLANPFAPKWAGTLARFTELWQRIVDTRFAGGCRSLIVTPEAGPPPYMTTSPLDGRPLADAWEVNLQMLSHLKSTLKIPASPLP